MSPESFAILIVAEDPALRQLLRNSLLATGFELAEASGTRTAIDMIRLRHFDLVMVDAHIAALREDACRKFRAQSPALGIIVVRANGAGDATDSSERDEWRMLEAGADDCLVAPFRYREIVARIGAVLRRPRPSKRKPGQILCAGNIELDLQRRLVRRGGNEIHLSPREFDLLAVLMDNKDAALTHSRLAHSAWGEEISHTREYLRTYIQSLRHKLENDPAHPEYIVTQPWVGYRFCDPLHSKTQNKTN
jgi:two-component system KDP operon response regulator KdpE